MISSEIHMDYLKPELWTNLGTVLSYLNPGRQILHILKTEKGKYKGVTSENKEILLEKSINFDQPDIIKIFSDNEEIDEIRIYTLDGLKNYYKKVQDPCIYQMDIDDYLIYLYEMLEHTEGISVYTRKDKVKYYLEYLKVLIDQNKKNGAFLLWLTKREKLYFNCILEYKKGKLIRLTTSDRYKEAYDDYKEVCFQLKSEYPDSTQCVTMEIKEFAEKCKVFVKI